MLLVGSLTTWKPSPVYYDAQLLRSAFSLALSVRKYKQFAPSLPHLLSQQAPTLSVYLTQNLYQNSHSRSRNKKNTKPTCVFFFFNFCRSNQHACPNVHPASEPLRGIAYPLRKFCWCVCAFTHDHGICSVLLRTAKDTHDMLIFFTTPNPPKRHLNSQKQFQRYQSIEMIATCVQAHQGTAKVDEAEGTKKKRLLQQPYEQASRVHRIYHAHETKTHV